MHICLYGYLYILLRFCLNPDQWYHSKLQLHGNEGFMHISVSIFLQEFFLGDDFENKIWKFWYKIYRNKYRI